MSGSIHLASFVATAQKLPQGQVTVYANGAAPFLSVESGRKSALVYIPEAHGMAFARTPPEAMAERQRIAVQGFQDALQKEFGADIAQAVLKDAKLDRPGAKLTGKAVLDTVKAAENAAEAEAKAAQAKIRQANLMGMQSYLPPPPGHPPSQGFATVLSSSSPGIDPKKIGPVAAEAIRTGIASHIGLASKGNTVALTPEAMAKIGTEVIRSVLNLQPLAPPVPGGTEAPSDGYRPDQYSSGGIATPYKGRALTPSGVEEQRPPPRPIQ
jgi:hypothetical protein